MGRCLGIDYGKKRIGLALSDPLGVIASGLTTVEGRSNDDRFEKVLAVIAEHEVSHCVLGLPRKTTGEAGILVPAIKKFGKALEERAGVSVSYVDERFTSKIAEQALISAGKKPSRDKGLVDKTAAALILQQYLDKQSR